MDWNDLNELNDYNRDYRKVSKQNKCDKKYYIGRFGLCTGHWTKAARLNVQNSVVVMRYEMAKWHETLFQHLGLRRQPYIWRQ